MRRPFIMSYIIAASIAAAAAAAVALVTRANCDKSLNAISTHPVDGRFIIRLLCASVLIGRITGLARPSVRLSVYPSGTGS